MLNVAGRSSRVESFPAYVRLVRKRGPQPYWTPVAPVHRLVSYPLSYLYVRLGLTPLAVTLWGLVLALAGLALLAWAPFEPGWPLWTGLALLNLGVIHDACDGEVARYRLHHRLQSTATYRVGIFVDFWAFAVVVQSLLPLTLAWLAHGQGAPGWLLPLGGAATVLLLAAYVAGFARAAYWPNATPNPADASLSLAAGGPGWLRIARKAYFWGFETALFTTHATLVVAAWAWRGGLPVWALAYVVAVAGILALAFLVATVSTLRQFDPPHGA